MRFAVDVRNGCVAVYAGERRQCLDGIADDPACVFYRQGKKDSTGNWQIDSTAVVLAQEFAISANRVHALTVQLVAASARAKAGLLSNDPIWKRRLKGFNAADGINHFAADLESNCWADWLVMGAVRSMEDQ